MAWSRTTIESNCDAEAFERQDSTAAAIERVNSAGYEPKSEILPTPKSKGLIGMIVRQNWLQSTKPMLLLISALFIGLFISSLLLAL